MTKKLNKRDYHKLLTRYLEGTCTKEELEVLNQWYRSFDEDSGDILDIPHLDNLLELKSEMLQNITKGIKDQEAQGNNCDDHGRAVAKVRVIRLQSLRRIAAVITVGIGVAILTFFKKPHFTDDRQGSFVKSGDDRPAEERPRTNGPATIYLADGSVVWLKENSRLEYPQVFANDMREVTLVGEAFFDVTRDADRPFVIHSANFTTRVLGTSFKIKDYEHEERQEVQVVAGKVMVSVKDASADSVKALILKSNERVVYSRRDNSLVESVLEDGSSQKLSAKSKLKFDEVALTDIVKVLNVVHGINITIADERLKNRIITADLTDETLEVSITILAKAINAEYTIHGKYIILGGKVSR